MSRRTFSSLYNTQNLCQDGSFFVKNSRNGHLYQEISTKMQFLLKNSFERGITPRKSTKPAKICKNKHSFCGKKIFNKIYKNILYIKKPLKKSGFDVEIIVDYLMKAENALCAS